MTMNLTIQRAMAADALEVALMVGELLDEIMAAIAIPAFTQPPRNDSQARRFYRVGEILRFCRQEWT